MNITMQLRGIVTWPGPPRGQVLERSWKSMRVMLATAGLWVAQTQL